MVSRTNKYHGKRAAIFSIDESDTSELSDDSDNELRELFLAKHLKPGLNVITTNARQPTNDTVKLMEALETCVLNAPWLERLDLVNCLAPLAPELHVQFEKLKKVRDNQYQCYRKLPYIPLATDPVVDDFKRELLFHRQAQEATAEGIRRLRELGVPIDRPADFFAEMAKSDEHMQTIRKVLLDKHEGIAKSELARESRMQQKVGKLVQRQTIEVRSAKRRKVLNDLKAFRKGKLANLDFLEGDDGLAASYNRAARNSKFGKGGRKRGMKRNTKASCMNDDRHSTIGKRKSSQRRPGKVRRMQTKNRRK